MVVYHLIEQPFCFLTYVEGYIASRCKQHVSKCALQYACVEMQYRSLGKVYVFLIVFVK